MGRPSFHRGASRLTVVLVIVTAGTLRTAANPPLIMAIAGTLRAPPARPAASPSARPAAPSRSRSPAALSVAHRRRDEVGQPQRLRHVSGVRQAYERLVGALRVQPAHLEHEGGPLVERPRPP